MAMPPEPDVMGDSPRCSHCDDWTSWGKDPAPDLCARCRREGKRSEMWSAEEEARYQALQDRLRERAQ